MALLQFHGVAYRYLNPPIKGLALRENERLENEAKKEKGDSPDGKKSEKNK